MDDFDQRPSFVEICTRLEELGATDPRTEGLFREIASPTMTLDKMNEDGAERSQLFEDLLNEAPVLIQSAEETLQHFDDVSDSEIVQTMQLRRSLGRDAEMQPEDLGGDVSLLRFILANAGDLVAAEEAYLKIIGLRREREFALLRAELFNERGKLRSFKSLPGESEFLAVWPHWDDVGLSRDHKLVIAHDLGKIDVGGLVAYGVDALERISKLRIELVFIHLDKLSREYQKLVHVVYIYDVSSLRLEHRRVVPLLKHSSHAVNETRFGQKYIYITILTGMGPVGKALYAMAKVFLSASRLETVLFLGNARLPSAQEALDRYVGLDRLPSALGGSAPAQDFEITKEFAALHEKNLQLCARIKDPQAMLTDSHVANEDAPTGIFGGMFVFDPDKTRSVLGKGAFGTVYRMQNKTDQRVVAVKELLNLTHDDGSPNDEAMDELLAEVRKNSIVQNEFIVQYITSAVSNGKFYVVMELINGVEYKDAVIARQATGKAIPDAIITEWTNQLCTGLAYLHDECHLIHQDLHNGNVMLTGLVRDGPVDDAALRRTRVKILDLGLASFKSDQAHGGQADRTMRMRTRRTMQFDMARRGSIVSVEVGDIGGFKAIRAPEMWPEPGQCTVRYNSKTDVWALGILLSEAILLSSIEQWYPERKTMQSFGRDRSLQTIKVAEVRDRSAVLGALVEKMLTHNPKLRPTAAQLLLKNAGSEIPELAEQECLGFSATLVQEKDANQNVTNDEKNRADPGLAGKLAKLLKAVTG